MMKFTETRCSVAWFNGLCIWACHHDDVQYQIHCMSWGMYGQH